MRKYEIYLPLKYNNGKEIEAEKFKKIRENSLLPSEASRLARCHLLTMAFWKYGGVEFIDDIIKIEIVAIGNNDTKRFLKDFKRRLKRELRQLDDSCYDTRYSGYIVFRLQ